jgi:hypothetical protein
MYEMRRRHHFWVQMKQWNILVDLIPVLPIHYLVWGGIKDAPQAYRVYLYWRIYLVKFIRVKF